MGRLLRPVIVAGVAIHLTMFLASRQHCCVHDVHPAGSWLAVKTLTVFAGVTQMLCDAFKGAVAAQVCTGAQTPLAMVLPAAQATVKLLVVSSAVVPLESTTAYVPTPIGAATFVPIACVDTIAEPTFRVGALAFALVQDKSTEHVLDPIGIVQPAAFVTEPVATAFGGTPGAAGELGDAGVLGLAGALPPPAPAGVDGKRCCQHSKSLQSIHGELPVGLES
jgi:hypothetical protein